MASTISFKKKPVAAPATGAAPQVQAQTPAIDVAASPVIAVATGQNPVAPAAAPAAQPATAANPAPAPAPAPAPQPAPAASGSAQVVTQDHYQGVGGFEGEFTSRDMATPYLGIMMKTSKNFDDHPDWLGQWVYDKEICLGESIKVLFLRAAKYYKQKTEWGSEEIPARFNKLADARAAGFHDGNLEECADLDVLIEVDADTEGVADLAHIFDGDKAYILARYSVRSTAYRRTVGILAKDSAGFLKGNLINGFYTMTTERKQNDKGSWYVPAMRVAGPTSQSLRTEIIARMGTVKAAA